MSISFKHFAGTLLFAFAAVSPAHATVVTFSSGGTIYSGTDSLNIFKSGLDLAGKAFTQSVTVDTSFLSPREVSPGFNSVHASYAPVRARGNLTIEGHTYSWEIEHGSASVAMWNSLARRNFPMDFMLVGGTGFNTTDGNGLMFLQDYGSETVPFLPTVDFAQRQHIVGMTEYDAHAALTITGLDGTETTFGAFPEWVLWEEAKAVPEPATLGMLMLGLGLIAARQQKRSKRPA